MSVRELKELPEQFRGGLIIFGAKRPKSSEHGSKEEKSDERNKVEAEKEQDEK
jgi:hypothetical protein